MANSPIKPPAGTPTQNKDQDVKPTPNPVPPAPGNTPDSPLASNRVAPPDTNVAKPAVPSVKGEVTVHAPTVRVNRANPADVNLTDTPEGRKALAAAGNNEHAVSVHNQSPIADTDGKVIKHVDPVSPLQPRDIDELFMKQLYAEWASINGYIGDFASESDSFQRAFRHVVKRSHQEGARNG